MGSDFYGVQISMDFVKSSYIHKNLLNFSYITKWLEYQVYHKNITHKITLAFQATKSELSKFTTHAYGMWKSLL